MMFKFLKRIPKKTAAVVAGLLVVAAVPIALVTAYGPERPVFDYNVNSGNCVIGGGNHGDRCGSMTGPVFNSFINTPTYGDERNFTRIAPVAKNGDGSVQNPNTLSYAEDTTATPGQEYWVRTLVHNNANQATNCLPEHLNAQGVCTQIDPTAVGIAHNTRVRVAIAGGAANGVDILSYVSANNATPGTVWDQSTLSNNNQLFSVAYVPGSAILYNPVHDASGPVALSDDIVSANGVQIGYNEMNGELPGCFDYSAYVYVRVVAKAPALTINKLVRKDAGQDRTQPWSETINAKPGDKVQWRIEFKNNGSDTVHNVTIRDVMPAGVTLVPGTITITDANRSWLQLPDTALGAGGTNMGDYLPITNGVNGVVNFTTTVNQNPTQCHVVNTAYGRATDISETSDQAGVDIEGCNTTQPVYSCNALTAQLVSDRTYRFTTATTAQNGATVKQYNYSFGDGAALTTNQNPTQQTHTYAANGSFVAKVSVDFNVNDEVKPATSQACTVTINTTTPTPTVLPNTGAGSVAGIFAITSVAGAAVYRLFLGRRLSREG